MQTIKKNWTRWIVMVAISAGLFFGGLALRLKITKELVYIKGMGFLMMFSGTILFGTLIIVFALKFIGARNKN